MLMHPPREREWISWLYVALWTLGIFAAIPVARSLQGVVRAHLGGDAIAYAVIAVVLAAALAAGFALFRRREQLVGAGFVWLAAVAAVFVWATLQLRAAPEEAMHFVQYGGLGVLAYRALTHRLRDGGIYPAAALVGALVGAVDEAIQWATPLRYWGLRDIGLNAFAAALVQVGIAKGLRPPLVAGGPGPRSVRVCVRIALAAWAVLFASALNTPERIEWYTARIELLAPLRHNPAVMFEYGHLYADPRVGTFRSRLAPAELARSDAERGAEAAAIVDRYPGRDDYEPFLQAYRPGSDPFLHEVRVHLYRRDRHLEKAGEKEPGSEAWRRHRAIALGEQRILEAYFANTLRHSGFRLDAATRASLEAEAAPEVDYESAVSRDLVTSVREPMVLALLAGVLVAIAVVGRYAGSAEAP